MLTAHNIAFSYSVGKPLFRELSLSIAPGERVLLQAPSGGGKTTLCKLLAGYLAPTQGEVLVDGAGLVSKGVCSVQMIMQHPELAVDPYLRMHDTLKEAGKIDARLMSLFEVAPQWLDRYPHELSGGELQRICIVRALTAEPRYLIADEISTMLDAVTQAGIWRSLLDEAETRNLGMVIVTHSAALAQRLATRTIPIA